jgi:hypothetical protein
VAVKVTLAPTATDVTDEVSVVVVTVEPVGACQKSPQPAKSGASASVNSITAIPVQLRLLFIEFALCTVQNIRERKHCQCGSQWFDGNRANFAQTTVMA